MMSYPTDIWGPNVSDKHVKFGGPRTNCSREIAPVAVRGGTFDGFFTITSDRKYIVTSLPVSL